MASMIRQFVPVEVNLPTFKECFQKSYDGTEKTACSFPLRCSGLRLLAIADDVIVERSQPGFAARTTYPLESPEPARANSRPAKLVSTKLGPASPVRQSSSLRLCGSARQTKWPRPSFTISVALGPLDWASFAGPNHLLPTISTIEVDGGLDLKFRFHAASSCSRAT